MTEEPFVERRSGNRELERVVSELGASVLELRRELVSKELYTADQARASERLAAFNEVQATKLVAASDSNKAVLELISERIATVKDGNIQTLTLVKDLEKQRAADRRLILTSMVLPILLLLLGAYIASQT